jgi:D-serine deaminase-like pyridoxal phosphate-dependent protein
MPPHSPSTRRGTCATWSSATCKRSSDASVAPLDTPSVLVDLDILDRNVRRMADFAAEHGVKLRPHAKSHKTVAIARRQVESGAVGLTVAKLDEAEAFLNAGFNDLFVANQVIGPLKWRRLAELQSHGTVAVGVDSLAGARGIAEAALEAATTVPVVIEIDTGLHRAGVLPGEAAVALARQIASVAGLELRGVFTHAGHAYAATSPQEVHRIGRLEGELLVMTADKLRADGIACPVVSVGSTPTAMISGAVPGVTEMRPGNYVFYDRMQVGLGSAQLSDCALTVLTTVISRPSPERAVIDAGSKTFALDRGAHGLEALLGYGEDNEFGLVLDRLSEEHGVILLDPAHDALLQVGDRLRILPNHACTTANLAEALYGMRNGRMVDVLPVLVRGGGH